jgi:hypothetical protein
MYGHSARNCGQGMGKKLRGSKVVVTPVENENTP